MISAPWEGPSGSGGSLQLQSGGARVWVVGDAGTSDVVYAPGAIAWRDVDGEPHALRVVGWENEIALPDLEARVTAGGTLTPGRLEASSTLLLEGSGGARLIGEQGLAWEVVRNPRAYLGVQLDGPLVGVVLEGSPAHAAGIQPGDRLVGLDSKLGIWKGERLDRFALAPLLAQLEPGEQVQVRLERGGQPLLVDVRLGRRPKGAWNKVDG